MTYCTKCGKPTDNWLVCEECIISGSPWLSAMKRNENDLVEQNEKLKAENAELKARIENAVELPCKIGDGIWVIVGNKYVLGRKVGHIFIGKYATVIELYDETGWEYIESVYLNDYKKTWFTNRTEAEARLAELRSNI